MKIYKNLYKIGGGLFSPNNEVNYSLTSKGSIINEEEWEATFESFHNSLYKKWYSYCMDLNECTLEMFLKMKETLTLSELKLIYKEYPFLNSATEETDSNNNENVGVGIATGVIIGKMM